LNLHDIVVRADRMLGSSPSRPIEAIEMKLPGGGHRVIAGGVPDARFSFDLRPSDTDFLAQLARDSYEPSEGMYETWCRHTASYDTPQSLRECGYSIHVNYYSVDSFRHLLQLFGENHPLDGILMESATNGKDFGFLIAKPS